MSELTPMPALAHYLASAIDRPVPAEVLEKAKAHLLDTVASIVSGSAMPAGLAAIAYVRALGEGAPRATVAGTALRTSPVMAALAMVDYVVEFDEDTPFDIISKIKPDSIVKGSSYSKDDIVGHDLVKEVFICPMVKGLSSTNILNKI
jgi:bifunctional ADP-heptose synthase (sugar kinase/adenylyltransferase)